MEINECKCYIHLLDLTRNSCEKCNFRSLAGIEPAIPVQRSNQGAIVAFFAAVPG